MPKAKVKPAPRKAARKVVAPKAKRPAKGVEPITEGPYANTGPEYEKRIAPGLE